MAEWSYCHDSLRCKAMRKKNKNEGGGVFFHVGYCRQVGLLGDEGKCVSLGKSWHFALYFEILHNTVFLYC